MSNLNQMYSGVGRPSQLDQSVIFIFDPSIGPSGVYRSAKPSDFAGGGGGGTTSQVGISGQTVPLSVTGSGVFLGRVYPITNLPVGTSGTLSEISVAQSGKGLVTVIPNLDYTQDSVLARPPYSSTVSGQQGPRNGVGTIFNSNFRNLLYVQNVGTNPLFVALSGSASPVNYSMILKGGTTSGDGLGGTWSTDGYFGSASISGNQPYYLAWEM